MIPLQIHVEGNKLVTSDGKETKLVGLSDFAQFTRWLQFGGKEALVRPIITERTNLAREAGYMGPLTARVFRAAAFPNAFHVDPWSYSMSAVREFTQFYNDLGWYVDWTSGDNQIVFPSSNPNMAEVNGPRGVVQHNNEFCANLLDTRYIWNVCNEPFKNGIDTRQQLTPPWAADVQYTGNYDDFRDKSADMKCINLHTDRSRDGVVEKWVGKGHESAPYLWPENKPIFYDEGMGADESSSGSRSNVPYYFEVLGGDIEVVNAVYFHSQPGLSSDGFGPVVKECWKAFCRGAVGGLKANGIVN